MGIHWYAKSDALLEHERALADVERRIVASGASSDSVDSAIGAREALYERESLVRAENERRGRSVTLEETHGWPAPVQRHVAALGPRPKETLLLDVLGWGADYYAENVRPFRDSLEGVSLPFLENARLTPREARVLAEEMLTGLDALAVGPPSEARAQRIAALRTAALWLWLWDSVGSHIVAGQ